MRSADASADYAPPASVPVYAQAREPHPGEIPVIDIGPLRAGDAAAKLAVARAIGRACETTGFLYVVNHGVPEAVVEGAFAANRQFFAQAPQDQLNSAATLDYWRGYVPSKWAGEGGTVGGAIQTYRFMLDLPPDDPDVVAGKPLHLPNRWPEQLPGFKPKVEAYFAAMLDLARVLRSGFALALDLPADYFEPFYRKPLVQLSLLHYRPPEGAVEIGAGEHRDTGAFTMLMQDTTGGLEICPRHGEWVAAKPIPGSTIINIGDSMMRWTNGRFQSTPHRVVNRATKPRYSVPFFVNPDYDVMIEPLPHLVPAGEQPAYPPLHNGQYMVDFYDRGMAYLHGRR